jgi:hypothetical protein
MTKVLAVGLGTALAVLAMSGAVQAQSTLQVQGTIQAVDCTIHALTLNASDGQHVLAVNTSTAVFVNSAPADFCGLSQYLGSPATAWVTPSGDQFLAGRVDVSVAAAPAPAPGYDYGPDYGPYYGPYYNPYYYPGYGIGIGIGPGFHDRDFGHDRDFHHDGGHRGGGEGHHGGDFGHGGHVGVPHGSGGGGGHGGGHSR